MIVGNEVVGGVIVVCDSGDSNVGRSGVNDKFINFNIVIGSIGCNDGVGVVVSVVWIIGCYIICKIIKGIWFFIGNCI